MDALRSLLDFRRLSLGEGVLDRRYLERVGERLRLRLRLRLELATLSKRFRLLRGTGFVTGAFRKEYKVKDTLQHDYMNMMYTTLTCCYPRDYESQILVR